MKREGPILAWQLQEQLKNDPEYQARMREKYKQLDRLYQICLADEEGLLKELLDVGIEVECVFDLVNTRASYPTAIPVLLKHLQQEHHQKIREGIIRALTVREARGIAEDILISEFKKAPDRDYVEQLHKWLLANALAEVASEKYKDAILELLGDEEHGRARMMLPRALARFKGEEINKTLLDIIYHGENYLLGEAIWALGKRKVLESMPRIRELTAHSSSDIRRIARVALKKLEKYYSKK